MKGFSLLLGIACVGTACASPIRWVSQSLARENPPRDLLELAEKHLPLRGEKFRRINLEKTQGTWKAAGVPSVYTGQSDHLELIFEEEWHYHQHHDRLVLVIDGEGDLWFYDDGEDQSIELEEGNVVLIESDTPHRVKSSDEDDPFVLLLTGP